MDLVGSRGTLDLPASPERAGAPGQLVLRPGAGVAARRGPSAPVILIPSHACQGTPVVVQW
eukprot:scaffold33992_cov59-Phaeocystis_antarctica.AAC.2